MYFTGKVFKNLTCCLVHSLCSDIVSCEHYLSSHRLAKVKLMIHRQPNCLQLMVNVLRLNICLIAMCF